MRKGRLSLVVAALAALGIGSATAGCTVIREVEPPRDERSTAAGAGYELGRSLLVALIKNQGAKFVSLLPDEMRERFTEENFDALRKSVVESVGEPVSFRYVTALELPVFTPRIWRVRCLRRDRSGKNEYTSEVLFRVVTGMVDGKTPVVTGFQFL